VAMSRKSDIGDVGQELTAPTAHPHFARLAVEVPLAPGTREMARAAIAEGPPFEPRDVGLSFHEILLTDRGASFAFGLEGGAEILREIRGSEDPCTVARWWERVADGPPRVAEVAFE
jgi:hypothetical protein